MKNLPDKIFLNLGDLTEEEYNETDFQELSEVTWSEDDVQGRNVEYIRKDAFIEKACEFISLNVADYIDVTHKGGIEHLALQEKFIEGFKKYMKGE